MNERIEELSLQCIRYKLVAEGARSDFDYKKFAELIVKECLKLLVIGEGNEKTSDAIWDLEKLGVDVGLLLDEIDETDGVEE